MAEPKLIFEEAFGLDVAAESADNYVKDLQSSSQSKPTTTINWVNTHLVCTLRPSYHCGDMHKVNDCRFKIAECKKYHKRHMACACRSKPSAKPDACPPQKDNHMTHPTHTHAHTHSWIFSIVFFSFISYILTERQW